MHSTFRHAPRPLAAAALLLLAALVAAAPAAAEERVTTVRAGGATLELLVLEPAGFDPGKPHPVLLALPPGGQDLRLARSAVDSYWRGLATFRDWIVVSPAAPGGALFVDDAGAATIPDLVEKIRTMYRVEGSRVHLAGVSNGGKSAFRAAIDHPELFASLTVMPGVPPSSGYLKRITALEALPVLMYVGAEDAAWLKGSKITESKLQEAGVRAELVVVEGDTHYIRSLSVSGLYDRLEGYRPPAPASAPSAEASRSGSTD